MQVLLVDDDRLNILLMSRIAQSIPGVQVTSFTEPQEALAWAGEHDAGLVLVDYMMPGMDGLQFIEAFRRLPGKAQVPLMMATADTDGDVRQKALALTATGFITKPVNVAELRATIAALLASASASA